MLRLAILVVSVSFALSSSVGRRDLSVLNQNGLDMFLTPLRESLLQKIAVGWNHTITDSAQLQQDMQQCSDIIKKSVETCKVCTAAACEHHPGGQQAVSHSPTFTDYLQFAASIVNPYKYLKDPLNEVGSRLGDLVDILGGGSKSFIDSMAGLAGTVGGGFTDAFHGLETGINAVKGGLTDAGNTIAGLSNTVIHGISDLGGTAVGTVGSVAQTVAGTVTDVANTVGHFFQNIFGKRDLTPEIRQCMQQCRSCDSLLITNQREMVKAVCGEDVVRFNDTVRDNVAMIKSIFVSVSDKGHPIVSKIEYDPSSLNGTTYSRVFVTANVKGRYVRYLSNVAYNMMDAAASAKDVAAELWQKWL